MLNRDIFSERLKQLKKNMDVSSVNLAKSLGIQKQSVSTWENKKTIPSTDKLVELADYFNVSIDYLAGRTDNPDINKTESK